MNLWPARRVLFASRLTLRRGHATDGPTAAPWKQFMVKTNAEFPSAVHATDDGRSCTMAKSKGFGMTKMVCTLGPASASQETIQSLVDTGMRIGRVNMSHVRVIGATTRGSCPARISRRDGSDPRFVRSAPFFVRASRARRTRRATTRFRATSSGGCAARWACTRTSRRWAGAARRWASARTCAPRCSTRRGPRCARACSPTARRASRSRRAPRSS